MQLRWADIDWEGKRIFVPNAKWKHYPPKRKVPLFPEVRRELQALFNLDRNKEFVNLFPNHKGVNLMPQFTKIASAAGIGQYRRPLLGMRNSRFNEIYAKFGSFYALVWLGVEPRGNEKFMRCVTNQDIQQAADWETPDWEGGL
jgi:integrase